MPTPRTLRDQPPRDGPAPADGEDVACASVDRFTIRDRIGVAILVTCALGALGSAIAAIATVADAGDATRSVETWRLVGYAYFAGIFVLLAFAPRRLFGLWELTIAAKLALPIAGMTFLAGADDARVFVVSDGILALMLIAAYVLMRGWVAPRPSGVRLRAGDVD